MESLNVVTTQRDAEENELFIAIVLCENIMV